MPQKIFSEEELLIETESDYIHNEELEQIMADKSGEDIDKEDWFTSMVLNFIWVFHKNLM